MFLGTTKDPIKRVFNKEAIAMAINEVFPNPTVKQVIFQVRFPNLFFLESRMGEFQIKVMKDFPKSGLALRRQFLIADGVRLSDLGKSQDEDHMAEIGKIWNFESETGIALNVKSDSLDLSSTLHKTYNNTSEPNRFRDSIKKAVDTLLEIAPVPIFSRVGLRYIDNCPVPAANNDAYQTHYNSTLALHRFKLEDAEDITHIAHVRRGTRFVRIKEAFSTTGGKLQLILDFDAYSINVSSADCMAVTDELHDVIIHEFELSLRPPVYEFMRKPQS
jgi:uncharacterized protein (TIGR04255 family)